jgi:phosphate starvation-inducible PhoH-like protein
VEIALTPVDNVLLANLCGPLDENIRQIELLGCRQAPQRTLSILAKSALTVDAIRHFYSMARQAIGR